jgi:hypothetical protein
MVGRQKNYFLLDHRVSNSMVSIIIEMLCRK